MEMLSFWLNFRPCLHWKLSFWQLWMVVFQMKVSTKQWHLCFSVGSKAMMLEVPWFFFFFYHFQNIRFRGVFFFPKSYHQQWIMQRQFGWILHCWEMSSQHSRGISMAWWSTWHFYLQLWKCQNYLVHLYCQCLYFSVRVDINNNTGSRHKIIATSTGYQKQRH